MDQDFPRIIDIDNIRHQISYVISQLPPHLVRDWAGKDRLKSAAARDALTAMICERLAVYQIRGREDSRGHSVPPT